MIVVPPGSFGEIGRRPRNRRWRFHICSRETWIRQGEKPAERNCCPGKKNSMAKKLLIFFQAGPWTPEATVEHPDAVYYLFFYFLDFQSLRQMIWLRIWQSWFNEDIKDMKVRQLHREFLRAGSDVMQVRKHEYLLKRGFHGPQFFAIRCLQNPRYTVSTIFCKIMLSKIYSAYIDFVYAGVHILRLWGQVNKSRERSR